METRIGGSKEFDLKTFIGLVRLPFSSVNLSSQIYQRLISLAKVAESADALDSKSSVLNRRVGSIPTFGTYQFVGKLRFLLLSLFASRLLLYAYYQPIGSKKPRRSAKGDKESRSRTMSTKARRLLVGPNDDSEEA